MSSTLRTFEIKLDNPTATYGAGAIITGQVVVDVTKTKKLRALKLRFKGKCSVHWQKTSSSGKSSRTVDYTGEEEYFRNDVCLFGSTGGDTIEMLAGHHTYPFSYALPRNIPNSFEHGVGSVEYSMKAIIDRPWKFDHETTKIFTVETPFELDSQSYSMAGIHDEKEEDYCCILPCISRGNMIFIFELPTTGYACGEPIHTTVHINNRSDSVEVEEIEVKLEQKLEFHARSPYKKTKTKSCVVQQSKREGPFLKKSEVLVGLQVPSVPLSKLQYCSLIDISYQVHIEVHVSGLHCKTEKFYDILIGTRPPAIAHQVHHPVPSQHPLPITSPSAPVDYSPAYDPVSPFPTPLIPMPVPSVPQSEKTPPYPQFPTPGAPYPTQSGSSQYPPPGAPYPTQFGSGPYPPSGAPYPTQPGPDQYPPNNAPYPNVHPFQYPSAPGFQPPRNVEFVPSNPTSPFQYPPEQLPPSYDSVMANDNRK
ncbi:GSCOCG00004130001-RA-CDS [Cotesia congregata]|uniref:Similar to ARRDC2: Arrestin domain-containing protein 2 (Homo sapiens) n=1 Tax=Cotesia congregata TaxID=51543 RepID=A0A8J2MV49_COTCN|nr:GSCOCG00004130001-RA-CDS [Cotesia congregata]CAG5109238.1 Similar to ARRDC2: Arrestin domain-containing protein 2 (Homo sapiens) [Cotesia congregata]